MALSPKEREQIVEEETLRFETRQNLHAASCSRKHGRRFGWPWLLAFFILGYAVHGLCGSEGSCRWHGGMHCPYAAAPGTDAGTQAPAAPEQGK